MTAVVASTAEKNLFYARTDVGGAYRWDEATNSWIPLLDWASEEERGYFGVDAIALDPRAANRLYLFVGTSYFNGGKSAILRSEDYGKTFLITEVTNQFKAHGNGMGRQNGERLAVDPSVRFVYLEGDIELIRRRLEERQGHYARADLLSSQLEALEVPAEVPAFSIAPPPDQIVARIKEALGLAR